MIFMIADFETRSHADLKKVGGWEYSVHPTTEIMCVAWRVGTKEALLDSTIKAWDRWRNTAVELEEFKDLLRDPKIKKVAHNAFFENVITRNVLGIDVPIEQWTCTAARAAALALPRDLEGACRALRINVQKDMDGRALMLKMTKPRKATKNNAAKWHETPEDVARLVQYCVRDIEAETQVFLSTPPLSPNERKIWELDQKINLRGVHVDRDLVKKSLAMVDVELASLNGELSRITGGEIDSAGQTARIKEFTGLPDTTAKTIRDALKLEGWGDTVRRVMEIRRDASKTSTAKYLAFEQRTRSDSVLRDILLYNGAMPTARWTGRGVQVQNFPRGQQGLNTNLSCEMVKEHDLETIRLLYGNPMDVFSSNLRGCLVPPEGEAFFCGDYASIEVRVLFWLAGNEEGLKALREGRDLYREMAVKIYNVELDKVTDAQREIGKRAVLGCGYQMGWETFQETCENFDTPVTDEVAKRAVNAFRETHHQVKQLWYNYEQAAIRAVAHPGRRFTVNRTTWFVVGKFLWCELPSGRRMAYPYPELRQVKTPWGELRAKLYHYDINPMAGGWVLAGTYGGKLAENVTQGGARDVMADSMVRLEETHKYTARLSVHDELLTTAPWTWDLKTFENLMAETPAWAEGLPVKVKAWKGPRYGKH